MLSNIYEYSSESVFLKDLNGKYLACNKVFAKIMKFSSPEAIIGHSDSETVSRQVLKEIKKIEEYVVKNNLPLKYVKPLALAENAVFEINFSPFCVDGEVVGILATAKNIKDTIRLENTLLEKNAQISTFLDSLASMVYIKDLNNKIISANKKFLNFFGYNESDITNNAVISRFDLSDEKELETAKTLSTYDKEININGQVFWFELQKTPLFDVEKNIVGMIVMCSDITKRKKVEAELILAKEKADEASRIKSEMIANISHELKTPIGCIMGILDLMAEQVTEAKALAYIKRAKHFSEVLLKLINTMLQFSKLERGKYTLDLNEFSVKSILLDSLSTVKNKAVNKNIELDFDFDRNLPFKVIGDGTKLFQVINNLLDNAIKFTDKGRVTLKTRLIDIDNNDAEIYFEVSDTGIGIEESMREKIFESFVQVDLSPRKKYEGAGLGLSICKRLLSLMNSKVICESTLGVGTKMFFTVKFECSHKYTAA